MQQQHRPQWSVLSKQQALEHLFFRLEYEWLQGKFVLAGLEIYKQLPTVGIVIKYQDVIEV